MNMDIVNKTFYEGIKNANIITKSFRYIDGCYVFKIKKKLYTNEIIHTEIRIQDGLVIYKTTVLTNHPIVWTRNCISRKRIRKFKNKYVIYSIESFDLLSLYLFRDIFEAYVNDKSDKIIDEINNIMERYNTIPLRGGK